MLRAWSAYLTYAAALVVAVTCWPALAQGEFREPTYLRLDEIIGMRVSTPGGETLGVIRDLIVDPRTRRVEYILVQGSPLGAEVTRYPVDVLVAGPRPGEVVVDGALSSSAAGASAMTGFLLPDALSFASAQRGEGAPVVHLPDGKLGFLP